MIRASRAGAGAVVSKSFNVKGREGYRNPSFIEVQGGFLNALGIPNPGMEEMREEVETVSKAGVPVIASVFGFDAEEFAAAAAMGEKGGAIAVELNVSCPHVREVGVEIGQRPKVVAEVTQAVKGRVKIPVFVKLSPNVTDITEVAKAAQSAGADAVTAINTALGMAVNVDSAYPILGGTLGGLSGQRRIGNDDGRCIGSPDRQCRHQPGPRDISRCDYGYVKVSRTERVEFYPSSHRDSRESWHG